MKIIKNFSSQHKSSTPFAFTLGVFDGVHKGHQAVIRETIQAAKQCGGLSGLITFSNHPCSLLNPEQCPPLLMTLDQRLAAIASLGIDLALVLDFTPTIAQLSAEEFLDHIRSCYDLQHLVLGHDARFGKNRSGDKKQICDYAQKHAIALTYLEPYTINHTIISSGRLREALSSNNVTLYEEMTGRSIEKGLLI